VIVQKIYKKNMWKMATSVNTTITTQRNAITVTI
jgi:hypothetical protein